MQKYYKLRSEFNGAVNVDPLLNLTRSNQSPPAAVVVTKIWYLLSI